MAHILAYDVGTGGVKAVLTEFRDAQVQEVGKAFVPYDVHYPKPGQAEQDPVEWWRAIALSTQHLLTSTGLAPEQISCLTFCTQMLGIVPVDQRGTVLHPAIIWLDSRGEAQAQRLMRKFLGPSVFAILAGCAATGKDVVPKWLWLAEHDSALVARTLYYLDVAGYLVQRCTGRMVMDWTAASVTGLFDMKNKRWDNLLFRLFGVARDKVAPLVRPDEQVGALTLQAASELGLIAGTPVITGAGDVPAAAVGSGAVGLGEGHISMGTSSWVGVTSARSPVGKSGIAAIQSADPELRLLVAESETAGACRNWLGNCLFPTASSEQAARDLATLEQEMLRVPAGAEGLIFTPWLTGERSPVADVHVRSSFINLGVQHRRGHVMRAVYEGVAYNLRWVIETIEHKFHMPLASLRVVGGGAQSDAWMQVLADVTGKRMEIVAQPQEAGAVGAACIAAIGMGLLPDFQSLRSVVPIAKSFEPRADVYPTYAALFTEFQQVYARLRPVYRRLNQSATLPPTMLD
jgi:xylulokinase